MAEYNHLKIEKKWQAVWDKKKIYQAQDKSRKKKFYGLIEFPYPSGAGLHVGHIRSNTAMDVISRKRRMEGYNVLYPIGWDAFGLPTENYAIKTGIHPEKVTKQNTDTFRKQLKSLGFSFDWSREVNTTDPKYYKWTQWIFLQFFKKGLAYKKRTEINWCPKDKIGLANEEVVGGMCERCGSPTEKREKEQWMLAITKYADRLDKDLDTVDYLEKIKIQQRNWIGKSEGAELIFKIKDGKSGEEIKVFTTRPDTLYGVNCLVLAPEHELILKLKQNISNWHDVAMCLLQTKIKTGQERTKEDKNKTGVELKGVKAINPATNEEVSIWISDYVLPNYGTGAIMSVPAHDDRDREFAQKNNLSILEVVDKNGILINSGRFTGMNAKEATKKIIDFVGGEKKTTYKLRDWVFSRQRYWGEPIPLIFCENCRRRTSTGWVPVPDKDLPIKLPRVAKYKPTDDGESPLADIKSWVNVKCPQCKGKAKRETDTMPNWAGSSWYYLRYADIKNHKEFASKKNLDYWLGPPDSKVGMENGVNPAYKKGGVNWYNGGMEHTTLHLLYSRFWHKFLYDLKLVPTSEPYAKRTSHGLILADDGTKFSKSKGNGINPTDLIKIYGADAIRMYEMFMGPFDQAVSWSSDGMVGTLRFLERVWRISYKVKSHLPKMLRQTGKVHKENNKEKNQKESKLEKLLHHTIKKVSEDIESMRFNTAVSSMMIFVNEVEKNDFTLSTLHFKNFLKLLAPFAPHITEELWSMLGEKKTIHLSSWPKWEEKFLIDSEVKIVIQVNGKVRADMLVSTDASEEEIKKQALALESVQKYVVGHEVKKFIYVKGRLVNIVI